MRHLRHYASVAYLRALYKASSPSGRRQRPTYHSSSRSHHRSQRAYEPQPESYSGNYYRRSRQPYEPREQLYPASHGYHANISSLPPELKHLIVSDLDPVTSACLGLASKDYYPIHRSHHKKRISLFDQAEGRVPLALYLRDWAPKDMILDPRSGRLVRREREPDGERARWERRLRRSKRYERMDVGRYRW